jgi:hypothetical protein
VSHFYGRLSGDADTPATRQGSKSSGIRAEVSTLGAAIYVELYIWNNVDMVRISADVGDQHLVIFNGMLEDAADMEKVYGRIAKQLIKA